jgi:hypothetical protein
MSADLLNQAPSGADVEAEFRRLADQWQRETAIHSNLTVRYAHPAYQRIVALGPAAIPLLLRELATNRTWLIGALWELTGEDPVPAEHRGRLGEMTADWLAWGCRNGYPT